MREKNTVTAWNQAKSNRCQQVTKCHTGRQAPVFRTINFTGNGIVPCTLLHLDTVSMAVMSEIYQCHDRADSQNLRILVAESWGHPPERITPTLAGGKVARRCAPLRPYDRSENGALTRCNCKSITIVVKTTRRSTLTSKSPVGEKTIEFGGIPNRNRRRLRSNLGMVSRNRKGTF